MRAPSGIDKTTKSNRCGTIKLRSHKWSLTPTRNRAAGAPFCAASIAAQVSPRSDGLHADFLFASINAGMAFIATAPLVSSTKILWQNDHSPTSQKTMRTSITKEITKGVYHWRGKRSDIWSPCSRLHTAGVKFTGGRSGLSGQRQS